MDLPAYFSRRERAFDWGGRLALDSGPMSSPALLRQLDSDVSSRKGNEHPYQRPGRHRCKWCFTDPNGRCIDCRRPVCIRHKPISSVIERRVESNAIREWQGPLGITPYPHPGAFAIWVPFDETFLWLRVTFADSRVEESLLPLVDGANYSWAEAERLQSMLSSRGWHGVPVVEPSRRNTGGPPTARSKEPWLSFATHAGCGLIRVASRPSSFHGTRSKFRAGIVRQKH